MKALLCWCLAALAGPATGLHAQERSLVDRLESLDVNRLEAGGVTVLYSAHAGVDAPDDAARALAAPFEDARGFFESRLGGGFSFTLALLSPRDWARVSRGGHPVPWSAPRDGVVVLPVLPDVTPRLQTGDSTRMRRVFDIVGLHQLGHVVGARYYYPAGFTAEHPPVRWFSELLASFLAQAYMEERDPELAAYTADLADDVVDRVDPRFSGLGQFDEYYDGYLTSPQGANTLGWYQNAFNLQAAELYEDEGSELMTRLRRELPWARIELWTTDSLLDDLEAIAGGFHSWASYLSSLTDRWQ